MKKVSHRIANILIKVIAINFLYIGVVNADNTEPDSLSNSKESCVTEFKKYGCITTIIDNLDHLGWAFKGKQTTCYDLFPQKKGVLSSASIHETCTKLTASEDFFNEEIFEEKSFVPNYDKDGNLVMVLKSAKLRTQIGLNPEYRESMWNSSGIGHEFGERANYKEVHVKLVDEKIPAKMKWKIASYYIARDSVDLTLHPIDHQRIYKTEGKYAEVPVYHGHQLRSEPSLSLAERAVDRYMQSPEIAVRSLIDYSAARVKSYEIGTGSSTSSDGSGPWQSILLLLNEKYSFHAHKTIEIGIPLGKETIAVDYNWTNNVSNPENAHYLMGGYSSFYQIESTKNKTLFMEQINKIDWENINDSYALISQRSSWYSGEPAIVNTPPIATYPVSNKGPYRNYYRNSANIANNVLYALKASMPELFKDKTFDPYVLP